MVQLAGKKAEDNGDARLLSERRYPGEGDTCRHAPVRRVGVAGRAPARKFIKILTMCHRAVLATVHPAPSRRGRQRVERTTRSTAVVGCYQVQPVVLAYCGRTRCDWRSATKTTLRGTKVSPAGRLTVGISRASLTEELVLRWRVRCRGAATERGARGAGRSPLRGVPEGGGCPLGAERRCTPSPGRRQSGCT